MMSPAYIAPGTLPKPPSVTTTKAVSPNVSPTEGDHGYDTAISAPAMPALPAASPRASAYQHCGVAILGDGQKLAADGGAREQEMQRKRQRDRRNPGHELRDRHQNARDVERAGQRD